jgi:transposase
MVSPPGPTRAPQENVLDPYHAQIDTLVGKYPHLSAVRVLEEIARGEKGYRGGVYPVRRYLRKIRPARGRVYQEVIYEPGEAVQVDWGDCGRLTIGHPVHALPESRRASRPWRPGTAATQASA